MTTLREAVNARLEVLLSERNVWEPDVYSDDYLERRAAFESALAQATVDAMIDVLDECGLAQLLRGGGLRP